MDAKHYFDAQTKMDAKQYFDTQVALLRLSKEIRALPLTDFIRALSILETKIVDLPPEANSNRRKAVDNMTAVKRLAQSMVLVQEAGAELDKSLTAKPESK